MSYLLTDAGAQSVQLKVQQLCVTLADNQVVSTSGTTATIDVGQTIDSVRCALFIDDSAGTAAPVVASARTVSGSTVALTLSAALAAADSIILEVVVSE